MSSYLYLNLFLIIFSSKDIFAPKFLNKILSLILCIILTIFVGLRYRVGGDWVPYEEMFYNTSFTNFIDIFKYQDSFFYLTNYLVSQFVIENGNIFINLIISVFIFFTFYKFVNFNKLNLLSFIIFYPFIIIIMMGFLRQSVALGFLFLILSNNLQTNIKKNIIYSILAGLFHISGFVFLLIPFISILSKKFTKKNLLYSGPILIIIIFLSIYIYPKLVYKLWIFDKYVIFTLGGLYKNLPVFLSSIFFLIFYKKFKIHINNFSFYLSISVLTIILYLSIFLFGSISDRILVYSTPLVILSLSKFYEIIDLKIYKISYYICIILFFLVFILYWFNYSNSSGSWIPYNIYIPGCCKKPYDFHY